MHTKLGFRSRKKEVESTIVKLKNWEDRRTCLARTCLETFVTRSRLIMRFKLQSPPTTVLGISW